MSDELRAREVLEQVRERDRYRHTDRLPTVPYDTAIAAMLSFASSAAGQREGWKHVKRGTVYTEVGRARLQNANRAFLYDNATLVVYRGEDGKLWAREESEFMDGRFERIASPSAPEERRDEVAELREALATSENRERRLRGDLTNAAYMQQAYRQMLGPKGRQVADMWEAQGVVRQHTSWGPGAAALSGEEIAQVHLDMDAAPKQRIEDVDGYLTARGPSLNQSQGGR